MYLPDRPDLALVFPAAHSSGGVERMTLYALQYLATRVSTAFVGRELEEADSIPVSFHRVSPSQRPRLVAPLRFRAAAAAALQTLRPLSTVSCGVICPPAEVRWVHSVHRAWVDRGGAFRVKGVSVPARARLLLPRHQVLLGLERSYFTKPGARTLLCTSQREVDDLAHYYAIDPTIMHVLPNPYDGRRFNLATRHRWRGEMRHAMGIRQGEMSLLFVANELHRKGFAVLLDAVARLNESRVRVDVVGKTSLDGYRQQVDRLGLNRRVYWHGPTNSVERYMAAGDVLVLPTQYEPFGLVIVEALACGLPVIVSALAGAADAVEDGSTGRLLENPFDVDELVSALRDASDDGRRDRWSAAAPGSVGDYEAQLVMEKATRLILG